MQNALQASTTKNRFKTTNNKNKNNNLLFKGLKHRSDWPFEREIELANLNSCLYLHVVFTFNCIINCSSTSIVN